MSEEYVREWFTGSICLAVLVSLGISFLFQIQIGSPVFFGLVIGFFVFFGVLWIVLGIRSSKKKKYREAKKLVEKTVNELRFADTQRNIAKNRDISLRMLEERVNEELNQIHFLFTERKLKEAQVKLFNCRRIAIKNKFQYLLPKIKQLILQLQYLQENQKIEHTTIIKKKVLELGTNVDRLFISDIMKATNIDEEDLTISVIKKMIEKKEIYAEYFSISKSIAFDLQANAEEIDKLMEKYREWEEEEVEKKD
jgi:hypothetical protein